MQIHTCTWYVSALADTDTHCPFIKGLYYINYRAQVFLRVMYMDVTILFCFVLGPIFQFSHSMITLSKSIVVEV